MAGRFGVYRRADETWREALIRRGKEEGLTAELLEAFDAAVERGDSEYEAAFNACYEWDVADWITS